MEPEVEQLKVTNLEGLESMICDGLRAYEERNRLIVDLIEDGMSHNQIAEILNRVRDEFQVARLTPSAISKTRRRVNA